MARRHGEPATITAHHDCEFRDMLDHVGDKWSLLVIAMLQQRGKRFMQPVRVLVTWLQMNWSTIRAARETFDGRSQSRKAS